MVIKVPVVIFLIMQHKVRREITCRNIGEPSSKAKYYKFSESATVL